MCIAKVIKMNIFQLLLLFNFVDVKRGIYN